MADLSTITYIEDFILDTLAIISLIILLLVLRKITITLSKLGGSDKNNKELVDFIQKSSAETLNCVNESLDMFSKHMEKIDKLLYEQESYSVTCDSMIHRQEEIINRQETMIKNQRVIMDKLEASYAELTKLEEKQENQETPIKIENNKNINK